jgi:phage terminase large subunit-like protein
VTTIAIAHTEVVIAPGYRGLLAFSEAIGEPLEPHERRIARAHFGDEREVYAVLPRGNLKTSLAAKIGLHHLLTVPGAAVTLGAASRDQARIAYERMKGFAQHPALDDMLVIRHLELRYEDDDGMRLLRVIPADGPRAHGLSSTLYIGDELWAWSGNDLLEAMLTGLVKNPDARFLGISTPAARLDSALGRARARALAGTVKRAGARIEAAAPGMRWLEWSLPEDKDLDDYEAVKAANPAAYITVESLREQAQRVTPLSFAQFHAGRWGIGEMTWLPPGAWSACAGATEFVDGEPVWVGVDVGGARSATAVVWMNKALHVGARIFQGEDAITWAFHEVKDLAERFQVVEVVYDPWRAAMLARGWEQHRIPCTEFNQSDSRMCPASAALYDAIVERKITHPDDDDLNRHVALAIAKQKPRGWRLDKAHENDQIDGAVTLAMVHEAATAPPPEATKVLGWL